MQKPKTILILNILMIATCLLVLGNTVRAAQELSLSEAPTLTAAGEDPSQNTWASALSADTTPPEILGVRDLLVYQGDTIAYRSGVTVFDAVDSNPTLEVDSRSVDLTTPGVYDALYIATDASGNVAWEQATVTVLKKEAGYVDYSDIQAEAQEVLSIINWPAASPREQVDAIYSWVRSNIHYGGHSDRTDWRQTAYTVLRERRGDCFGFFSVSKLLFEALGIPNLDVTKVKNNPSDSEHYWSLVSVDGGRSYYHFDSTPRISGGDFCLVTDAFLDAYSAANKDCYNRDTALYPETPKEALR